MLECLRQLIQAALILGVFPETANKALIKPLIKDESKSRSEVSNTRPISVSDSYCTILEKYLLSEINKVHVNDEKQFGFKTNSSCSHATFTLLEATKHSKRKGYKTYVCAIDAAKAFDKVNRHLLFKKVLFKTNWPLTRAIINYNSISFAAVSNNGEESEYFKTSLGVKQGGS